MQAWISYIQGLAFRMEKASIDVSDQDKILAITMGLPPSFDSVIINFDSMAPDALTLDLVIAQLLNEEVRQGTGPAPAESEALAATLVRKKPRLPAPDIRCYFCDGNGHYKSDCPERKAWEKSKGLATMAYSDSDSDAAF